MEHVTVARVGGPNPEARRFVQALAERLGDGEQIRTSDQRNAEAARERLAGAMERLGIESVSTHVCRHDEGIGDCS